MKKLRLFLLSILMTLTLTAGLGALASLDGRERDKGGDLPVFTPDRSVKQLQEELLVDQLQSANHSLPISRVHFTQEGSLILDVKVAASIMNPALLYEEMAHWLNFSFHEMNNVNRLELRMVIDDRKAHKKQILLGLDALKEQATMERILEMKQADARLSEATEQALRMTYTSIWHKIFDPKLSSFP
ncbi:hypothetical protein [Paenibacillus aquistagni]|uniref:hypothetical protein n=1 Tax=Paenibacillus aquistagni TaxID=1852522 RepID=UPI00145B5992|nr:hypothetical protein [Paenibacillus aquistagni]NMM54129.1 hypothetical protein [Paenibacillus aquistagni]